MKATIANAKKLGAVKFGWAHFKHALMRELEIPETQFISWGVPAEWRNAFLRANGKTPPAPAKKQGRPLKLANGKRRNIFIDEASWNIAERIGGGSASEGIRIALELAASAEKL